jgi:hypothetical protein
MKSVSPQELMLTRKHSRSSHARRYRPQRKADYGPHVRARRVCLRLVVVPKEREKLAVRPRTLARLGERRISGRVGILGCREEVEDRLVVPVSS